MYVEKTQLADLRTRLESEQVRLESETADLRDVAIKASTYLEDENDAFDSNPADNASSMVVRQTDMTLLQNLELELADTEAALRRMDDGRYGVCEVCDKEIAERRLQARPAATTCIECQSAIELRQKRETAV